MDCLEQIQKRIKPAQTSQNVTSKWVDMEQIQKKEDKIHLNVPKWDVQVGSMKKMDINYGEYASKYGIADFYPDSEEKLRAALKSGEEFDTGWFGCEKEIRYAKIVKHKDSITVFVSAHMDDLYEADDLIYDALWHINQSEEELPDEIIDSIRDAATDCSLSNESTCVGTLPPDAEFEEICKKLKKLESEAEEENNSMFDTLCGIVKDHLNHMKEREQ